MLVMLNLKVSIYVLPSHNQVLCKYCTQVHSLKKKSCEKGLITKKHIVTNASDTKLHNR